jgi:hypothetical protein
MSEWGGKPDGLDPPGEQLELPWDGPAPEAVLVETIVHRVTWGPRGWSCACGAGKTLVGPVGRSRGAAVTHMRAVANRLRHAPG